MQRDRRYWRDPDFQRVVEQGYRLLYPNQGQDAAGRVIIAPPREGRVADLRRLAANDPVAGEGAAVGGSGSGTVHVDAYTRNGDEAVREHYRGKPDGFGRNANAMQRPSAVSEENWRRYKPIFESGLMDIEANAARAKKMSMLEFVKAATDAKQWDLKNNKELINLSKEGSFTRYDLQDFGNYHFGYMANEFGFDLGVTLAGAGVYQAFWQGGGNKTEALLGVLGVNGSREGVEMAAGIGFTWGDNPGDAKAVMRGWLDRQKQRERR